MPPYQIICLTDDAPAVEHTLVPSQQKRSHDEGGNIHTDYNDVELESSFTECDPSAITYPDHQSRHVHFSHTCEIHPTICLSEYTRMERCSLWYSRCEMSQIRIERNKSMPHMAKGKPCKKSHKEEMTYQGLESSTWSGAKRLHKIIPVKVINAVLDEQDRQWRDNCVDANAIALTSIALSGASRQQALALGRDNEKELQELDTTDTASLLHSRHSPYYKRLWWHFNKSLNQPRS